MISQLAGYKYARHFFTWYSNTIYGLQCTDNTTMKIAEQFVISLAASSVGTPDFECSSANTLPGGIPPRDPPIVNPVRAPYQDPNHSLESPLGRGVYDRSLGSPHATRGGLRLQRFTWR